MPDLTGLTDYASTQIAAVIFIICCVSLVRAFINQRWGAFFSSLIFGIVCWVVVANPGEFEDLASSVWGLITRGGLS
ncbi:hypothetical protein J7J00_24755 [Bacillus sp. ISL-4]|uniref:TcpD family membrane protein n=1 Tax=Bacillus sp. ISL-4 TaxID=2819125 RepID=UPI001BEA520E|nr:TcpD family membrane protein [Bacillus sp. ISL-4]MBT2668644.1 hypothetical protein [Bacillus sp. ISL-4]MBT2673382.1 hypothetical protein [Streptomyces sp. ISL-14]